MCVCVGAVILDGEMSANVCEDSATRDQAAELIVKLRLSGVIDGFARFHRVYEVKVF